jgi:Family of unknown function (DUF6055)
MRRALVIGLVAATALTAVGTTSAATPRERPQIQARASLERALAIFRGEGRDPRGATGALLDLRTRMGALSPAERRQARILLARPTDGHNGDWTAPKSARRRICTTHFCIHWVKTTGDAPNLTDSNHNGIPNYVESARKVMKTVWNTEVGTLGYDPPMADGNSGSHHGGNPNQKIDIYLQDVGRFGLYGYCTTDDPRYSQQSNVSAYCVYDDDFSKKQFAGAATGIAALKVTAAHEFNHAIQFSYDVREDRWLLEATATNMEASVYPSIHDNYQYFPSSPISKSAPWRPIDLFQPQGGNQYGVWIFFHFLCQQYGDCDIVREIWVDAEAADGTKNGGLYSTQAVEQAISDHGDTFADIFREFSVANSNTTLGYTDGAGFGASAKLRNYVNNPMDAGFIYSGGIGLFHMANDYIKLVPGTGASTVDFHFELPNLTGAQVTVIRYDENGTPQTPQVPALVSGNGDLNGVAFSTANTSKIVLAFTNANTQFSCNQGTNLSCHGDPLGDSSSADYSFEATVP